MGLVCHWVLVAQSLCMQLETVSEPVDKKAMTASCGHLRSSMSKLFLMPLQREPGQAPASPPVCLQDTCGTSAARIFYLGTSLLRILVLCSFSLALAHVFLPFQTFF